MTRLAMAYVRRFVRYATTSGQPATAAFCGYRVESIPANSDGRVDLVVANRAASSVSLFTQQTDGSFALADQLPSGSGARAVAEAITRAGGYGRLHWPLNRELIFPQLLAERAVEL